MQNLTAVEKNNVRLKKVRKLHYDWRNMSKNEANISILERESYTNSLLQIFDLLAKGMLLLLGISWKKEYIQMWILWK